MIQLTVDKLLPGEDLLLENGSAVFNIENNTLKIEVQFPAAYPPGSYSGEESKVPKDYYFKSSISTLELELPVEDEAIFGREIFIDSEGEDNEELTNFHIAHTHYPTFDDRITLRKEKDKYILNWTGLLPDIKNSRYEIYMKNMFPFRLQGECRTLSLTK